MPAAIPIYLKEFDQAPPGHRFGLYFAGWDNNWSKPKNDVTDILDKINLPPDSRTQLAALVARQQTAAQALGDSVLNLPCIATSPFATGLGNEHPLENGFAFLNPYGLPYLAGSGVKGVIRRAAEELATGDWGEAHGWSVDAIRSLFGPGENDPGRDSNPQQGALRFWDVFPQPQESVHNDKPLLAVEIMTPHHGGYYQDSNTPHNSETPIPIAFLAVATRSRFAFHVECNPARLTPDLQQAWKTLVEAAFDHAGQWLGFGAKTSVGYGRMKKDDKAMSLIQKMRNAADDDRARKEAEQQRKEALEAMSPLDRSIQAVLDAKPKDQPDFKAIFSAFKAKKWQGDDAREVASRLQNMLKENRCWREKSEKKKPEKDEPYQMTLEVLAALRGQS